ncbi:hypothetical protein SAMN02927921_02908 [Sinomicrobium oceani]|uniref:Uncharacterized protein n=1 Tax=Sinomicrobium oceani TaxID=1150368 RepID=A0A1K1QXL8_9FLAO|nr:DUF6427 family protein [Sinomicrobium oceani]SFW64062.1 hypothetical protein SAMN02927921_02908 [Sinomicrobium oceani]
MISSFFNGAKPINFLLIVLYVGFFYWITQFYLYDTVWTGGELLSRFFTFLVVVFSVFLVNFIIRKNTLCEGNAYGALLFVLFLCAFPQIFRSPEIIMANLFVLLALRRMISIRSLIQIKQKIFDAALWICVAGLFYEWTLVFLVVVFAAVLVYRIGDYRNWLVPFVAVFVVGLLLVTYVAWCSDMAWVRQTFPFSVSFYSARTTTAGFVIPLVLIALFSFMSLAVFLANYKSKPSALQSSLLLVVITLLVASGIAAISNNRESDEVVFTFFPAAVLMANYLQLLTRKWWKEFVLWVFVALPVILLFV